MRSAILESNARPCDEVFDGVRHEDLTGTGRRGDARSDVDRDAADLLTDDLALAGMQAAADLQVQRAHLVANPACTANDASWAVERGEEPVAGGVDLPPAEPRELAPCHAVVLPEQLAPTAIADRERALGGPDDIGEQDRGEHAVSVRRPDARQNFLEKLDRFDIEDFASYDLGHHVAFTLAGARNHRYQRRSSSPSILI
jgi:hypothetical protein